MLVKLHFLQSRYILFLIAFIAILGQPIYAANTESCEYKTFNIKVNGEIKTIDLLSQIADSCDFSIVVQDNFANKILKKNLFGININSLSLNEIFDTLLLDNDLYYEYTKNFLKIYALKTKTFKVDYITSIRTGSAVLNASLEGSSAGDSTSTSSSTNTISSNDTFDFWSTLKTEIKSILNTGSEEYVAKDPIINQNAGLITITATKKQLDRIQNYLKVMQERLHKQVLIDVSIFSVDLTKSHKTGIDWSKFDLNINSNSQTTASNALTFTSSAATTSGSALNIVNDAVFTMKGLINFLGSNGDTSVISNPKILALNNQQALITIGDTINYKLTTTTNGTTSGTTVAQTEEVKSIFVGVLLNITPEITSNGEIILRINPSVSELKNSLTPGVTLTIAPDTSEKKLSTVVKVKNNNTIILGGLITTSNSIKNTNVPMLSDIPVLGEAFKSSDKSKTTKELVFVITPRIIGPKDNTKTTLRDLGFSKRVYEQ